MQPASPLIAFLTQPGMSNNLLRYARIADARSSEGVLFNTVSITCCLFSLSLFLSLLFFFPFPFVFLSLTFFFSFVLLAFFEAFFRKRACLSNSFSFFLSSGEPYSEISFISVAANFIESFLFDVLIFYSLRFGVSLYVDAIMYEESELTRNILSRLRN